MLTSRVVDVEPTLTAEERVVDVEIVVAATGRVSSAEVAADGIDSRLCALAIAAALQLEFVPAQLGDAPVATRLIVPMILRPTAPAPRRDNTSAQNGERSGTLAQTPTRPEQNVDPRDEVIVHVPDLAELRRRSEHLVSVVDVADAEVRANDMADILGGTEGVFVRRQGALGSRVDVSLGGFDGNQVLLRYDDLPLQYVGFPFGVGAMPRAAIDRLEVYHGVTPARFGGAALGGVINFVPPRVTEGKRLVADYLGGSFGTYRLFAAAMARSAPRGWWARVQGGVDQSDNDFPIQAEYATPQGELRTIQARRFHDAYAARFSSLEFGRSVSGADLSARLFLADHHKELQHADRSSAVPFGGAELARRSLGAHLNWTRPLSESAVLRLRGGLTSTTTDVDDQDVCTYDWLGQCAFEAQPGELGLRPIDLRLRDQIRWGRLQLSERFGDVHRVEAFLGGEHLTRQGRDAAWDSTPEQDVSRHPRQAATGLAALTWASEWSEALKSEVALKQYGRSVSATRVLPSGELARADTVAAPQGASLNASVRPTSWFSVKAGYERALRFPTIEELFGNGATVFENLDLAPERTHNFNLAGRAQADLAERLAVSAEVAGLLRSADQLISPTGAEFVTFQNVARADGYGYQVHAQAAWDRIVEVSGRITWLELINQAHDGELARFHGQSVPNRPKLKADALVQVHAPALAHSGDRLTLGVGSHFVDEFYRSWETLGASGTKNVVEQQLTFRAHVAYDTGLSSENAAGRVIAAAHVDNFTDARVYDFFGIQRPGRAAYFSLRVEI